MAHRRDEFVLQSLQALAFRGIAQRPQKAALLDLAFDEIVLCALLERLLGHGFIVQAREHHEGNTGRRGVGPPYRPQPLCIRQPRVEQDDVDRMLRKMPLGRAHAIHVRQFGGCASPAP